MQKNSLYFKDLDFHLIKALEKHRLTKEWKNEPLSDQELSNLLWAACRITKEETKTVENKKLLVDKKL